VSDLDNENQNVAIADFVQHAVVADSDSEIVAAAGQFFAARWPWIIRQSTDGARNP